MSDAGPPPIPTPMTEAEADGVLAMFFGVWGSPDKQDSNRDFMIATLSLLVISVFLVLVLTAASFIFVRSQGDPARKAANWLKATLVFMSLSSLIGMASYAAAVFVFQDASNNRERVNGFAASSHIELLWELLNHWTRALLLGTLVRLATGIHRASQGGTKVSWHQPSFLLMMMGCFTIAALAATSFSLATEYIEGMVDILRGITPPGPETVLEEVQQQIFLLDDTQKITNRLAAGISIIVWIVSIAVTLLSVQSFLLSTTLRSTAILSVAANVLNFVSTTWGLAFAIRYRLSGETVERFVPLLQTILGVWPTIAATGLVLYALMRQAGGVWSGRTQKY